MLAGCRYRGARRQWSLSPGGQRFNNIREEKEGENKEGGKALR